MLEEEGADSSGSFGVDTGLVKARFFLLDICFEKFLIGLSQILSKN